MNPAAPMPLMALASGLPSADELVVPSPPMTGRVLAVVVLYNKRFDEIPCAAKIKRWLDQPANRGASLHLVHCLVYDNSPVPSSPTFVAHARMDCRQDPFNGGTRAAYLAALDMALAQGCPWVLLLDHDTDLPDDFFTAADRALAQAATGQIIAAVVPQVFHGVAQVSPSLITGYGRVHRRPHVNGALSSTEGLTAIASASLIQSSSLSASLPIPETFRLDYLDHWLFREIQRRGGALAISSARIDHSLSVLSMQSMDLDRYCTILAAELLFLQGDPSYSRAKHGVWHLVRTVKLALLTRRLSLLVVCLRASLNIMRGHEKK